MHNGITIVGANINPVGDMFFEVMFLILFYIIPQDLNMLIAVTPGLFVPEACGMQDLMYDAAKTTGSDVYPLLASTSSYP
jgi:hypothetical protein